MTSHLSYSWVKFMVPFEVQRRVDSTCFRDGVDRGDLYIAALKAALDASERGQPIISKGT